MEPTRPRSPAWRLGTPVIVLLCGALFVVSAEDSQGTDLRPGRFSDLSTVVDNEAARVADLRERTAQLDAEVRALSQRVSDRTVNRYRRQIEVLGDPAGTEPRSGPGVTVTLSDAPAELIESVEAVRGDVNPLVVHQQDIQAVVNALWKGGATAVTIQGQRVVSTTGIKCEGSSVQLQGFPYPQPYVISGIGDQQELLDALADDRNVGDYRAAAADPTIDVGFDVELDDSLSAPGFSGVLDLQYAEPLG
ncbi:DUF881 domain-containing protein [Nocardioides perillae]|uniref:Uncharacterized protein YlxW (UPF0749 family) n=1 Tax=Nocardioides perillae TaxID=1119534 RepID=A0A7Y9RT51_9ACTN|nr:DUF881 domain-containing protein [Nocardioides perillae]NYG54188.1 uncharacterized protein YlxW (UPF0749 family) [Nocardioides perillae]